MHHVPQPFAPQPPGSQPSEVTPLHVLIARRAADCPGATAVVDGDRTLTYGELERDANQLAHRLIGAGAAPGEPVGVYLHRGADLVVSLLAVWKAGASYVPLDPGHPHARTSAVLADSGATLVVAGAEQAERLAGTGVRTLSPVLGPAARSEVPQNAPGVAVSGLHPAYVLHTSGSTGRPKGVVVSHGGLANQVGWRVRAHGLGVGDRVLQKTPMTFDAAGWEVFAPLSGGGTVVMAPAGAERDPALLVRSVAEHRITVLQVVPSVLRMLVEEPGWEHCTHLRLLSSGGEQLHAELAQRFLRCVEDAAGEVEVWNTYGPTECTNEVTGHLFDSFQRSGPVPIGTPVHGMRTVVAHPDGSPVEPGIKGELYLGGIGLAHGYAGRPGLTADRFVPDPYGPPGARLYRTGDLVRERVDGSLEHLGRTDRQLKVDGVRIEPAEVEDALAAHPGIRESAVTPFTTDDGSTRLAAYVRCDEGAAEPTAEELRDFLSARLPDSHLPAVCVHLKDFPRTASGKLDRLSLPAPDVRGDPAAAPSTEAEELVAGVWRELFRTEAVGVHDDFFRLGGSSLQLTRLANRLRDATGREIELPRLLRATTVAAQARLITEGAGGTEQQEQARGAAAVRPVPRTGALPLSLGQRRLWLLERINPRSREWVTGVFLRVPRADSPDLVRHALDELMSRHEALRTRFVTPADRSGDPVQVIDPPAPMELRRFTAARSEVASLVEQDAADGFDLERGPVVRALLISHPGDAGRERTLVLLMHHIVGDGWSATILKNEFYELLTALRESRRPRLPELEVHYADYAVWQHGRLTRDFVSGELGHWRSVLDGAVPLALRTDKRRPPARDARGAVATFTVPGPLAEAVAELGRRGGATPFMALLTAFTTLLARFTAQWDVVIGTPVAGRERPEIENIVGFFLNTLVLRCQLDGSLGFGQALERVRDVCKEAFGHQELPFEELVAELAPERDLSRTPLYQVAFDYHDEALTGSAADADDMDAVAGVSTVAKTDLTLYMRKQPDGTVVGALEYATSLFEHSTVERMAACFLRLLESAVAEPRGRLDTLELLPDAQRAALSRPAAGTGEPVTASVPALFEQQAAAVPDAVAVAAGSTETTYARLDQRANKLARRLRKLGVGPESVVGVLLERDEELPTAFLAVWKAGGAYLPLDPAFPAERAGQVLADAGAEVLLTRSPYTATLAPVFPGTIVATDTEAALTEAESGAPLEAAPHLDRRAGLDLDLLAYVIYTSGSTGRPKGVQVTHRGLANHIRWAAAELASRGTGGTAVFSSVAFDLVMPNLWAPLVTGQTMRLLPQDLDLAQLGSRLLAAAPYSFLKLTPGHLDIVGRQLEPEQTARLAGAVVVAGEALPVRIADEWSRALGPGRLINEYGPTEASVGTCTYPVRGPAAGGSVPIGRPLPGMTMHVLDDLMRPVPAGVVGELYVGGTGVARGYGSQPELTAARFVPDPYGSGGARLYRTGDLVRLLSDGSTDFVGRIDGQVKIRGHRVETGEIASVLDEHPDVRESVVVAVEDADGSSSLAAYWVPAAEGRDPAEVDRALAAHCADRLPDYMVPRTITPIGAVPLNANGKLDRNALPRAEGGTEDGLVEPRGVVEERIAELFEELLGVRAGAHSHFFRSGGNSILAIRLIAEIQAAFDVDFPTRAVFEGSTVAELAAVVEAEVRAEIEAMSESELRAEAEKTDEDRSSER